MAQFDHLLDNNVDWSTCKRALDQARNQGLAPSIRECLDKALEYAESRFGAGRAQYQIVLGMVNSL